MKSANLKNPSGDFDLMEIPQMRKYRDFPDNDDFVREVDFVEPRSLFGAFCRSLGNCQSVSLDCASRLPGTLFLMTR